MRKAISFLVSLSLAVSALPALAQVGSAPTGQLVKSSSSSAVYYLDADGKRYVFPNSRIYLSWYDNFNQVVTLTDAQLSQYPLGGVVPYKAGKRLVKIQSDPKVYAVDDGGILRWVKSEQTAKALYGQDWNKLVDDLSPAFFANYTQGQDIESEADFNRNIDQQIAKPGDSLDQARNKVDVCHLSGDKRHTISVSQSAEAAHLAHGDTAGSCSGEGGNGATDTVAPVISGLHVFDVTASTASVSWSTDEPASYRLYFDNDTTIVQTEARVVSSDERLLSQTAHLFGLSASTAYVYEVVAKDQAGNSATSPLQSFLTLVGASQ